MRSIASESSGTPITSVTIPGGQSGITFYYDDTQAGTPTVTADDPALSSSVNQVETVVSGPATHVAITSAPFDLIAGNSSPVTIQLEDAYNNMGATSTIAQTINLSTTSTGGEFYASASGGTPITSIVISRRPEQRHRSITKIRWRATRP